MLGAAVAAWVAGHRGHGELAPPLPLTAYRLVYHVATPGSPDAEEERLIRRPYDGRYLKRTAGSITTGAITNEQGSWFYRSSADAGWIHVAPGKQRATGDQNPRAALRMAIENGLARVLGHRRVLGRRCDVVRTGGPLGRPVTAPTAQDHDDLCLDRTGVILAEEWSSHGAVVRRLVAIAFAIDGRFEPTSFTPDPEVDPGEAAKQLPSNREITSEEQGGLQFSIEPPTGYRFDGGSVLATPVGGGQTSVTAVQRFLRGADLLLLRQGQADPAEQPSGRRIGLGRGVIGFLTLDMTASWVEVRSPSGTSYARIEDADPAVAIEAARRLQIG